MLQLCNVVKTYEIGDLRQDALKGVSLLFRDSEFVSILGQSGSGKTTMLNIIGGLDRYSEGDLLINGVSTKEYTDADWDSYRNHTIGFVFQSYNLIPHQTVLANVEMALTLAGVSKKERRQRAVDVLKKVGLEDHIYKKPNQMSGGQMQRVAIARALINNPDILLADEPTGALDSETSVQIMELLKEISKDKLVIMVTHNPELAEKYSTRVINLLDGKIVNDTDPYEYITALPTRDVFNKVSMSFATALSLSFNNLRTKKARTILTAFAGSIGIIGIGLILAISTGMNVYIDNIQKDTMSSFPLMISSQAIDNSAFESMGFEMMAQQRQEATTVTDRVGIYANYTGLEATNLFTDAIKDNNLAEFKKYLDDSSSEIHNHLGEKGIVYDYDIKFSVYSKNPSGEFINSNDGPVLENASPITEMLMSNPMISGNMSAFAGLTGDGSAVNFSELPSGINGQLVSDSVTKSYDLLYGSWPTEYNQVVLVLDNNNSITLEKMYQLGFIGNSEYNNIANKINSGEAVEEINLDYSEIANHKFYLVAACDHYKSNADGTYRLIEDITTDTERIVSNAVELTISGVIRLKPDSIEGIILTPVGYTTALKNKIIEISSQSEIVKAQLASSDINVLNNMKFVLPDDAAKITETKEYLKNASDDVKASVYQMISLMNMSKSSNSTEEEATQEKEDKGLFSGLTEKIEGAVNTIQGMRGALQFFSNSGDSSGGMSAVMNSSYLAGLLDGWLEDSPDEDVLLMIYDQFITESTYQKNLATFGYVDYDVPSSISIYSDDFEGKDGIASCIEEYNSQVDEDDKIYYTDFVAMLTSSLTTIINGVSYVLVAFVAISLFVSCIMIGIITHISVVERTKEIGILRALGASKNNISQVFNAETFIIGCCSGLLGVGVSLAALIPINSVIEKLTGIADLDAQLSVPSVIVLICISIVITLIGGLIPAKNAANKDPVIALRSE